MALKIRLRQQGRKNRTSYRLVVADVRAPRDGKYVEALGWYNPLEQENEKQLGLKEDRIQHWLDQGAEITEKAGTLIKRAAPTLMRQYVDKQLNHRNKERMKRRGTAKTEAAQPKKLTNSKPTASKESAPKKSAPKKAADSAETPKPKRATKKKVEETT